MATNERNEKNDYTSGSPDQAGASGAYGNRAIAMMPPGQALPASELERVLAIKIARAMASCPREITKNATVAEMGAEGKLVILRQGTNEWICFPGNENEIGNVPMCADPMGLLWMMDIHASKPKPTNAAPGRNAAQHHRSVRQNQSGYPSWSALDDYLAFRRQTLRSVQHCERRGDVGDVRRHSLRPSTCLRHAVGRQRMRARPSADLDDAIW
jgi:hypothetical protein